VFLPKGEVLETSLPGTHSIEVRRPLGVVASFTSWNGANVLPKGEVLERDGTMSANEESDQPKSLHEPDDHGQDSVPAVAGSVFVARSSEFWRTTAVAQPYTPDPNFCTFHAHD